MSKPTHFEICREMARRNMDIRMSLLENVTSMTYSERTKVTIGIDGNVIAEIYNGQVVGGLLLCNRDQYFAVSKELEQKQ